MTCIKKTYLIFMICREVLLMWQRFVITAAWIGVQQSIENMAKCSISAHELQRPVCRLRCFSSLEVGKKLRKLVATFFLSNTVFLYIWSLFTGTEFWKQRNFRTPTITTKGRPILGFGFRRDLEAHLFKNRLSPNIAYRFHWSTKSFFET